jgi:hypothetical protein
MVSLGDLFIHMWARHGVPYTSKDYDIAKEYFDRYPEHKYHRGEWIDFINRVEPEKVKELEKLDGKEFSEWCSEYAKYYAEKMKKEAKEMANNHIEQLKVKHGARHA